MREVKCKDRKSRRQPFRVTVLRPAPRNASPGRVRERPARATDGSVRVCACLCAPGKETELPDKVSRFQSKAPVKHEADVSK